MLVFIPDTYTLVYATHVYAYTHTHICPDTRLYSCANVYMHGCTHVCPQVHAPLSTLTYVLMSIMMSMSIVLPTLYVYHALVRIPLSSYMSILVPILMPILDSAKQAVPNTKHPTK